MLFFIFYLQQFSIFPLFLYQSDFVNVASFLTKMNLDLVYTDNYYCNLYIIIISHFIAYGHFKTSFKRVIQRVLVQKL